MSAKTVRNIREPLKKPRPLKSVVNQVKENKEDVKTRADVLSELEVLNVRIGNCNLEEVVSADISQMCNLLKRHGDELDNAHKDALDRYFCTLRNACREEHLDAISRLQLLEIIEMRAMHWKTNENLTAYFNNKYAQLEEGPERLNLTGSVSPNTIFNSQSQTMLNSGGISLAPGEFLRSSGKFSKPTKIAGKNYFKDEIVIRNCDSGKVMGIKGRRVHMIEELSDTVISFQRVNAGARDRLVQITGPHEEAISHAKYLVEDTIKRNVSPIRDNLSEPLDNKEHLDYSSSFYDVDNHSQVKRHLMHSYSTNDATTADFSIPVQIGHDVIMLSGSKSELLKTAKMILLDYFTKQTDSYRKESSGLHPKSSNQRFSLKKEASFKDSLPSVFTSERSTRRSVSMSSSSDDVPLEEGSSDADPPNLSESAPVSSPTQTYTRGFLLECARLPLSQKKPPNLEKQSSACPEIVSKSPVMFEPDSLLLNEGLAQ